jgi:hypothetical protein
MSAYQSMIAVLADVAEEPEASAIEILETLRTMPDEVAQAGVDPGQWKKACEAMIAIASKADNARRAREAEVRREDWPEMRKQLERFGCEVTNRDGEAWRVIGTGVSIDIDLRTGDVQHLDGELGEQLPEFERIADHIVWSVASRQADIADLARRTERRKTHRWDNKKKVWLPHSGVGPVIKGGE